MNESSIEWELVNINDEGTIEGQEFIYDKENKVILDKPISIEYQIYKYTKTDDSTSYYQRVINLPFYCKSAWTKTPPKKKDILNLLESALRKRYKDIILRDFKYRKKMEKFETKTGLKEIKDEYSYQLHHKSPLDEINNKKIGTLIQDMYLKTDESKDSTTTPKCALKWEEFVKMMLGDNCAYCGISMKLLNNIKLYTKRARGYSMEIDQKDPYGYYSGDNCVACCYWCNNAKTDEFSVQEFKEIARGINAVWNQRLEEAGIEKIKFPSKIWEDHKL